MNPGPVHNGYCAASVNIEFFIGYEKIGKIPSPPKNQITPFGILYNVAEYYQNIAECSFGLWTEI